LIYNFDERSEKEYQPNTLEPGKMANVRVGIKIAIFELQLYYLRQQE